jgi:hypothetical protein
LAFWSSGKPSTNVKSISDIQRCISWAVYETQFGERVPVTISPPIFLNGYISPMWKKHIDLSLQSITLKRCLNTMTCVLVLTIWRRHCHMLPIKAGRILTLRNVSTYYQLPTNGAILVEPIFYASTIVSKRHFSDPYHNRYIIWEKFMSAVSAEVSN